MGQIEQRLSSLSVTLPTPPPKAGLYKQSCEFGGNLLCVSGCGPDLPGMPSEKGRLGELTVAQGREAARRCMLNALAIMQRDLGTLDRVARVVKMLAFVSSAPDFYDQPMVANGASELLTEVFGEKIGCPTRSAIGTNVLPGNIPVEIELMVELKAD